MVWGGERSRFGCLWIWAYMRDLGLSRLCCWRYQSSGMWSWAVGRVLRDVSKDPSFSDSSCPSSLSYISWFSKSSGLWSVTRLSVFKILRDVSKDPSFSGSSCPSSLSYNSLGSVKAVISYSSVNFFLRRTAHIVNLRLRGGDAVVK